MGYKFLLQRFIYWSPKRKKNYCLRLFNCSKPNIQEHMFGIYMTQLIPTCRLSLIHGKVSSWALLLRSTIRSIQTGKHEPRECTFTAEVLSGPICPGITLASLSSKRPGPSSFYLHHSQYCTHKRDLIKCCEKLYLQCRPISCGK